MGPPAAGDVVLTPPQRQSTPIKSSLPPVSTEANKPVKHILEMSPKRQNFVVSGETGSNENSINNSHIKPDQDNSHVIKNTSKKPLFASRKTLLGSSLQNKKLTEKGTTIKCTKQDAYDFREDDSDFERPSFPPRLPNRRRSSATSEPFVNNKAASPVTAKTSVTTSSVSCSSATVTSTMGDPSHDDALESHDGSDAEQTRAPVRSATKRTDAVRRRLQLTRDTSVDRDTSPERSK